MKYAITDLTGNILSIGESNTLPEGATEVTHSEYENIMSGSKWQIVNEIVTEVPLTAEEIAQHLEDIKPKIVTKLQLMEAMLETDVIATSNMWLDFKAIKATNELLSDYWDSALDVNRNHPMTLGMKPLMNKTDADLDALFLLASTK